MSIPGAAGKPFKPPNWALPPKRYCLVFTEGWVDGAYIGPARRADAGTKADKAAQYHIKMIRLTITFHMS